MTTTIQLRNVETDRFLGWLSDVLKRSEAISLEVHVVEDGNQSCSIKISMRDVPPPLTGGGARPYDEKQLEIFG